MQVEPAPLRVADQNPRSGGVVGHHGAQRFGHEPYRNQCGPVQHPGWLVRVQFLAIHHQADDSAGCQRRGRNRSHQQGQTQQAGLQQAYGPHSSASLIRGDDAVTVDA